MNSAPQFSLRWNNYVSNVTEAFNLLRFENDLVDVTLCCDGGKIKAHKMLLSACSNYFKQIFKDNPCQHPVIIFRNVKFDDLNAIINFMYHGEVNIFQEQLESFLITAELLEVKGLTDNAEEDRITQRNGNISLDLSSKSNKDNIDDTLTVPPEEEPINLASTTNIKDDNTLPSSFMTLPNAEKETEPQSESNQRYTLINSNVIQMPSSSEEMQIDNQTSQEVLEKANAESDMGKFKCQLCPKGFKHPTSLTLHKDSHAGKTQCPVCHRSFSRSYDMRSHLQRIHQGKQLTIKEIRYKSISETKPYSNNI